MRLETIFQVSIYGLVSLAGISLALAEGSPLAAFTLPLALLALFFSERWKSVGLPQLWANLLGIAALMAGTIEFTSGTAEARLLSGAHFLVYLTWIALFQTKTVRLYWWLCALSVLQMAVGSVLSYDPIYGWLLVVYLLAAVWTLSVFSLFQAEQQFAETDGPPEVGNGFQTTGRAAHRFQVGAAGLSPGTMLLQPTTARGTIQLDPSTGWINFPFAIGMLITAGWSLVIAAAFFLMIPRLWIAYRPMNPFQPPEAQRPLTGFTNEVQLGDLGQILESTDSVLAVRIYDNETNEELDVEDYALQLGYDEPLFRGAVLARYENGRWKPGRVSPVLEEREPDPNAESARQEVTRQPIGTDVLFAIHPALAIDFPKDRNLELPWFDPTTFEFHQPETDDDDESLKYIAYSPRSSQVDPTDSDFPPVRGLGRYEYPSSEFLKLPPSGLERLREKALEVVEAEPGVRLDRREAARKLVAYLRDSGEFTYSLDASIVDVEVDPVEDFLFNRKSGHCEYYAATLALMLRAVRIPSRMISGFKGGDRNMFNGNFEVQQRHAHAWVEAYLDRHWVTLDATPFQERTLSVEQMAAGPATWRDFLSISSESWKRYVVHLNYVQQYRTFYEPMVNAGRSAWSIVRGNREEAASAWAKIVEFVTSPSRWFSWQGLVVTLVLGTTLTFAGWLTRRVARRWKRAWLHLRRQRRNRRGQVEFYERFKKLCAATGLTREPGQTQREFAVAVHRSWNAMLDHAELDGLPNQLTESFYRVRFGRTRIDDRQAQEIDRQLTRLEQTLPRRRMKAEP